MADTGMRFAFSDEQRQLRAAVRRFCAENFGERAARRLQESEEPFDTGLWRRLGSELGVLGMSVSEDDGGAGGCLVDQAVAVEEFGASLAAGPLFGTVYLAIPALAACPRVRTARTCWAPSSPVSARPPSPWPTTPEPSGPSG